MREIKLFKLASLAFVAALSLGVANMVWAAEGHDHGTGHSDGDGHKHDSHKHDGHMKDDHDHGSESAADHAKHHPKPSHGGVVLELDDHHGELVVKDGKLALYLTNHDGKAEPAKGFEGTAMILTSQGRHGPLTLADAGGNKLEAAAPVALGSGARVSVTLKDPHGHTTQARYQMP